MSRTEDPDVFALDDEGDGVLVQGVSDRLGLEPRREATHFLEAHVSILALYGHRRRDPILPHDGRHVRITRCSSSQPLWRPMACSLRPGHAS